MRNALLEADEILELCKLYRMFLPQYQHKCIISGSVYGKNYIYTRKKTDKFHRTPLTIICQPNRYFVFPDSITKVHKAQQAKVKPLRI